MSPTLPMLYPLPPTANVASTQTDKVPMPPLQLAVMDAGYPPEAMAAATAATTAAITDTGITNPWVGLS